jgi:hypothetical protein
MATNTVGTGAAGDFFTTQMADRPIYSTIITVGTTPTTESTTSGYWTNLPPKEYYEAYQNIDYSSSLRVIVSDSIRDGQIITTADGTRYISPRDYDWLKKSGLKYDDFKERNRRDYVSDEQKWKFLEDENIYSKMAKNYDDDVLKQLSTLTPPSFMTKVPPPLEKAEEPDPQLSLF